MAKIYIVATPIGNLEDITHRAVRVLSEVDVIFCEDTRITKRLLEKYEINTPTESYNAHASDAKHKKIIELLKEGKDIALVSDAGTPTISDPGVKIVNQIKTSLPSVKVISIPGPSALTAALSISGIPASEFLFLGFLPHKKGRQTLFKEIADSKRTVVFYESPHRLTKSLESLKKTLENTRSIVVTKEISKIHEEIVNGTPEEVLSYFSENPAKIKGEFVVLVEGR